MPVKVQKLIESFLSDITLVIPEQADGCIAVRESLSKDADGVIRGIVRHLGQHDEAIVARDDTFLLEKDAEVIPGVKLADYWNEISETSRDTVWKYLNLMLLAGAKHVRALDRKDKNSHNPKTSENTEDLSGEDIASEIAKRLRDPEVRDQVMETIRNTMESIPDESDEDVDPTQRLKSIENLVEGLQGTQIGKIVEEIASDLSGEFNPETLGLPSETDMKSLGPQDLIGLLSKPELMKKIMTIVSKIGNNLNQRVKNGSLNKEELAREGKEMLSKSQDLLKSLSPQAAKMLSALQGSGGGKVSTRKMARAMKKMGGMTGGNTRTTARDRLRQKLAERKSKKGSGKETTSKETHAE